MRLIKVCVITSARSEYGLMRWLMDDLKNSNDFELQILVTGSHLLESFGFTYREIENDGFTINTKIPFNLDKSDQISIGQASADLTKSLVYELSNLKPDVVMVMGDRYELLSVMTSCIINTIPIAHISGGEITEGAIDDQIRHAMTKASHFHYVANKVYGERLIQMGEEDWRVCISGEPGLDNLNRQPIMNFDMLQKDLGINLSNLTAIVTFHPVTLELEELNEQMQQLIIALEQASLDYGLQYLITFPNADAGSKYIIDEWKKFVKNKPGRKLVKSLGQTRYLSSLKFLSMMIGNSSSGLVEAPSFRLPVVNIGNRQKGRMRGKNVFDVGYTSPEIIEGIERSIKWDRTASCFNPYGDGMASKKIIEHLRSSFSSFSKREIISKKFIDKIELEKLQNNFYDENEY
tara:strand:+ start:10718 stop:11935 length:1218 start_codon:yes stop_codon:yes gene_type:complete